MLRERVAIALLGLPVMLWVISAGGLLYLVGVGAILALAAFEFGALFRSRGRRPSLPLIVGGVLLLAFSRYFSQFEYSPLLLAAMCLVTMLWHMIDYERGASGSGTDFVISLAAIVYIGWIGSYLISLRLQPDGVWWVLLTLQIVWLADSGAYFFGKAFGRNKLAPRLSPKKTWEGYFAGIGVAALGGIGLGRLWAIGAGPAGSLTTPRSLILGLALGVLAPLGDLGISMIKRELEVKDSGALIPGHGGVLDRIDSWLWAGILGYYIVSWLT